MKRIKKYLGGSYFRLPSLSSEFQTGAALKVPYINTLLQQYITNTGNFSAPIPTSNKVKDTISNIGSSIIGKASDAVSDKIFGDSELGRNLGTIFSSGLNSVGDTVLNNAIKKAALTDGLTKNLGSSVGGAVAGLGANYLGRGITSILGNNAASRFLGLSASTVGGTIGGKILSSGTKNLFSGPGSINPIGLGMSAVGAGLSAATGPSKEYNGTYGSTTKALDTVYDALLAGIGLVPGGQVISGALALNKGLSNLFGSTDGMTSTDAILGSAFMPAPIKWLNMLGSSKTGTFNNQSWLNTLKTSNFMQNAFGNLQDKFNTATDEAGKTYGTFSQGAKKKALNNIDFANYAWNKILDMTNLNEYQNIRSSDMASINNLRYALWILGGFSPLARGKLGMKILNNSINHNLGLRLLSGAALIDNKQMILSALNGTKIKKKGVKSGINVDYYDPNNVMSVVANNPNKTIVLDEMTIKPNAHQRLGYYMKNAPAADIDKVMLGTLALGSAPIAALAAIPGVSTLGDYVAGTKLVNVGNKVITNPYVSSAIESAFAGHGLNHIVNEGINGLDDAAMTALEVAPLGKLARPIYEGVVRPGTRLFNSHLTGNWTKIGNREYRLSPNSLGANGSPLELRAITPRITAENAANYPSIIADAEDFSFKGGSDLFTRKLYNMKIHGQDLKDFSGKTFSSDVKKGISNKTKEEIRNNVVRRNMREFMNDGLTSSEVAPYATKVEKLMNNINIGRYSQRDYEKAGWGGFGGFYDPERNFISINREAAEKGLSVEPHEVRHAIDHNIDDEILTPTSEIFGKDFDSDRVLSSMQRTKQKQNMILQDAYDNDFIDIPNKPGYNEGLENYPNLEREAITTNRDAREALLGSKKDWEPDITDKIIDKMPDTAIFEAVEKANGYGRRFIKFLRENNKLSPKKAQQFREAMKHVGVYAAPVGVTLGSAATLYNKSK